MSKRLIYAITLLSITVLFSACSPASVSTLASKTNAPYRVELNSIKLDSLRSSGKVKTIVKSQAEIDSERPDRMVLKPADKGEDVIRIQTRLKIYGYNINIDGDYGNGTIYAVMNFQKTHNLQISGIVSEVTLADLYKTPTKDTMYKPATESVLTEEKISTKKTYENILNSVDSTSNTDNYILVNLSEQKVYIFYGNNHNWKLINTFFCGSGLAATPTVTGHFHLGIKGLFFKSGTAIYCKYFSQISGNYLFHSILYDKDGNILDGNLGAVESHGCIRLALQDAKYIYDNIPIGSGIWIN